MGSSHYVCFSTPDFKKHFFLCRVKLLTAHWGWNSKNNWSQIVKYICLPEVVKILQDPNRIIRMILIVLGWICLIFYSTFLHVFCCYYLHGKNATVPALYRYHMWHISNRDTHVEAQTNNIVNFCHSNLTLKLLFKIKQAHTHIKFLKLLCTMWGKNSYGRTDSNYVYMGSFVCWA